MLALNGEFTTQQFFSTNIAFRPLNFIFGSFASFYRVHVAL